MADTAARVKQPGWWTSHPLLICYAPLGDPGFPAKLLEIYARGGVDVVEAGVPTANPYLDGPTVADSMRRARARGMHGVPALLEEYASVLKGRCRLLLMGYPDMPFAKFTSLARTRIVEGLLIVEDGIRADPPGLAEWLSANGVVRAGFVDAALSHTRIERALSAGGYVMLQACSGPTGVREKLDSANAAKILALRSAGVRLPVVLGFGIGTPEQAAKAIALGADGVVVGSACIEAAHRGEKFLSEFIVALRASVDAAMARRAAASAG